MREQILALLQQGYAMTTPTANLLSAAAGGNRSSPVSPRLNRSTAAPVSPKAPNPKVNRGSGAPGSPRASNQKPKVVLPVVKFLMIGSVICLAFHYALDYGGFRKVVLERNALVRDEEVIMSADGTGVRSVGSKEIEPSSGDADGTGADKGGANGRTLLVTDTFPSCSKEADSDLSRFAQKNKIDYASSRGIALWAPLGHLRINGAPSLQVWKKIVMLNYLWQSHTNTEWFVWMNDDVSVLDMGFEIPWPKYKKFDLILWGRASMISEVNVTQGEKSQCKAVDTSVMLVRRSKWSRKLLKSMLFLQKQSELEPEQTVSKMQAALDDLPEGPLVPDCALSYLLATNSEWRRRIFLETEYGLREPWTEVTVKLEDFLVAPSVATGPESGSASEAGSPTGSFKSSRWATDGLNPPFIVSFKGCNFCDQNTDSSDATKDCIMAFRKAYAFANTQVIAPLNLRYETLYDTWVVPKTGYGRKEEEQSADENNSQSSSEAAPSGESSVLKDAQVPAEENSSRTKQRHVAAAEEKQIVQHDDRSSPTPSLGEANEGLPVGSAATAKDGTDVVDGESQASGKSPVDNNPRI